MVLEIVYIINAILMTIFLHTRYGQWRKDFPFFIAMIIFWPVPVTIYTLSLMWDAVREF